MTYYGAKELAESFRTVRNNTIKIAEEIPENKYDFKVAPDTKPVSQQLAHIALAPQFQRFIHDRKITDMTTVSQADFGELFQKFSAEESKPRTKAELVDFLKAEGESFAQFLEGLSESFLAETVTLPPGATPPAKTRFEMLLGAKEHEMHHRGQLMVIERVLGIVPHLTRLMQERMAAMQAQAAQAQTAQAQR
jgi:uncharacterized damage-inducible protein DinB